jgi:microcompartment protein CcmL/EutN
MKNNSLGLIETWGLVPAIVAADAASKAALVSLLGYEMARAGLVTIKVIGDVAAVKAAVSAGAAAAEKVGKVNSVHVIPRPDRQLRISPPGPDGPEKTQETAPPSAPPLPEENMAEPPKIIEEGGTSRVPVPPTELPDHRGPEKQDVRSPKARKHARPDKYKLKGRGKSGPQTS